MAGNAETNDVTTGFDVAMYDVAIVGRGNSAALTALALAQNGFSVWTEAGMTTGITTGTSGSQPESQSDHLWQRVLALSPAARHALEMLGVWQHLAAGHAPVADIAVGGATDKDLPLRFALGAETDQAVDLLSYIVSVPDITAAVSGALHACAAQKNSTLTSAAHAAEAFCGDTGTLTLADGSQVRVHLLVDASGAHSAWRQHAGIACWRHAYGQDALTAEIQLSAPHGNVARQAFLPDGPLALLPLPAQDRAALVWSLPARKARALSRVDASVFDHELNRSGRDFFGSMHRIGTCGRQPLMLQLAEKFTGPRLALIGEAAHVIHPLAGQGMNLTLRDIGALTDALVGARKLGLNCGDAAMLDEYVVHRRSDAMVSALATHALCGLFTGRAPVRWLAAAGMRGVGQLGEAWPDLKQRFRAQADRGTGTASRLFGGTGII
ncbi:MAG TPA: hypothetical protein DIT66_02070 [Rhodobiaceae bacterium]|nr:hypothetical protein [Rhodobiaceae bacterium]